MVRDLFINHYHRPKNAQPQSGVNASSKNGEETPCFLVEKHTKAHNKQNVKADDRKKQALNDNQI